MSLSLRFFKKKKRERDKSKERTQMKERERERKKEGKNEISWWKSYDTVLKMSLYGEAREW